MLPVHVTAPLLKAESGSFPAFTTSAARGKDGKITIAVANADKDHGYRLTFGMGSARPLHATGQILTANRLDAHNTPGAPEQVFPQAFSGTAISDNRLTIEVPAKAVVVVSLD